VHRFFCVCVFLCVYLVILHMCYNNTTHMQYDKINTKNTNTKESRHSEMGQ